MFSNGNHFEISLTFGVESTPTLVEFLEFVGEEVLLQGYKGFAGGLDVKC